MDAAERAYREDRGLAKAAEEGARAHLANVAASIVPIHESVTLLDPNADGWDKAQAAVNFVAKAGSLYLGLRGAPNAASVVEGRAGSTLVPAEANWQHFLPEAEARLAAAKTKYGDSPLFAMERPQAPAAPGSGEGQTFYRGARPGQAPDFTPRPNEFKVDPATGYVKDTHGVSVFDNPRSVSSKGYDPYEVDQATIPDMLQIKQRGADPAHYEIMPREGAQLTPAAFTEACKGIVCKK